MKRLFFHAPLMRILYNKGLLNRLLWCMYTAWDATAGVQRECADLCRTLFVVIYLYERYFFTPIQALKTGGSIYVIEQQMYYLIYGWTDIWIMEASFAKHTR